MAAWGVSLVVITLVVGYTLVRANSNDGLPLNAPVGSVAREQQLDEAEVGQTTQNDDAYAAQQQTNSQVGTGSLNQMSEAVDAATH